MKPFMRVVLDEMVNDPDPIRGRTKGSFAGYDGANDLMISWDDGRSLKLIDGVDKYHVVGTTGNEEVDKAELDKSFENLRIIQDKLDAGESSRCPRCGEPFDCRRGVVSHRVKQVMICPLCGQQETIEDFISHGKQMGAEVEITVLEGKNRTGHFTEEAEDGKQKLKVTVKPITDWYIVKIWQGCEV